MSDNQTFFGALETAIAEKTENLNAKVLPGVLSNFQLLHTCVKNMYTMLVQRALIKPDPYKLEKKITEIVLPDESTYMENERSIVMGTRFSDYESMLEFVCTYYKFSTDRLDLAQTKRLLDLATCIDWRAFSINSSKVNTRGLATLVNEAHVHAPQMVLSLISDSLNKSSTAVSAIYSGLTDLVNFKRESYKFEVRKKVLENPAFDKTTLSSYSAELAEIKRLFPKLLDKKQYYAELIQEIAKEDCSPEKEQFRQQALSRLRVTEKTVREVKQKVNTRAMLLDTVLSLSALAPQYEQVIAKIDSNHAVLISEHNGFFDKLKRALRQAFNLKAAQEEYELVIVNQKNEARTTKKIEYNTFFALLVRKQQFLQSFADTQGDEFRKIAAAAEETVLGFVNRQLADNWEILLQLNALDEYFKSQVAAADKDKIKGMKMELVTMKNTLVKTNQKRAEYVAVIEEKMQMEKLGIDEDAL
ncbi:hypothetical protein [Treponema socranskii]|nr:hypothetical protein [Treponema socranskii]MDR9858167.1 hypothetical protein [Treponema socranskii]